MSIKKKVNFSTAEALHVNAQCDYYRTYTNAQRQFYKDELHLGRDAALDAYEKATKKDRERCEGLGKILDDIPESRRYDLSFYRHEAVDKIKNNIGG